TLRVDSMTYSGAGASEPMNTMEYFCGSDLPNHNSDSGTQLIDGNGRKNDSSGLNTAMKNGEEPSRMPNGTATSEARQKPTMTRRVEARMLFTSVPSPSMLTARFQMSEGAGRNNGS